MALTEVPIELSSTPGIVDNSNATAITIDSSENVGIGTSSPDTMLHLSSATNSQVLRFERTDTTVVADNPIGIIEFEHQDATDAGVAAKIEAAAENASGGVGLRFETGTPTTITERLRIDPSGNVGIGETTPLGKLHIKEDDSGVSSVNSNFDQLVLEDDSHSGMTILSGTSGDGAIYFGDSGSNDIGQIKYKHSTNQLDLTTSGSTRLTIDSSGYVGIGTSSPSSYYSKNLVVMADGDGTGGITIAAPATDDSTYLSFADGTSGASRYAGYMGYAHSSDSLFLGTNGGTKFTILSDGKTAVGGNHTPATTLDVAGDATIKGGSSGSTVLTLTSNALADTPLMVFQRTGGAVAGKLAYEDSNTAMSFGTTTAHELKFLTSNTERMQITSAGYIQFPLATDAMGMFSDNISEVGSGNFAFQIQNTAQSALKPFGIRAEDIRFATGSSERMRIDSSGRVGIGGTPRTGWRNDLTDVVLMLGTEATFHSDAGVTTELWNNAYVDNSDNFRNFSTRGSSRYQQYSGAHKWFTAASASAGTENNAELNVTPKMELDVNGNLLKNGNGNIQVGGYNSGTDYGLILTPANTSTYWHIYNDAGGHLAFGHSSTIGSTEKARINSSGNFMLGLSSDGYLTADDGVILYANGGARFGGSGTSARNIVSFVNGTDGTPAEVGTIQTNGSATSYNTSSDQRLKSNIVDAPSASDDIDAIQVRSFDWKADGSHQKYGMVAQELVTVAPSAVSQPEDPEEMMGVDYSKLVPMLIKEVQQLRARVAQLEGEN